MTGSKRPCSASSRNSAAAASGLSGARHGLYERKAVQATAVASVR